MNTAFEKCKHKKKGNNKTLTVFFLIHGEITNKLCNNTIGIKIIGYTKINIVFVKKKKLLGNFD